MRPENPQGLTREALAHVTSDGRAHLLIDHLRTVSALAAGFAEKLGGSEHARIAGLWHDLGKYSGDFQRLIREENGFAAHIEGEGGPRDHSTAGALLANGKARQNAAPITFAIAGHHAGLADLPQLTSRLQEKERLLAAVLTRSPHEELLNQTVPPLPNWVTKEAAHRFELWIRMLFSSVCDADFLDTEHFYDDSRTALRQGRPPVSSLCQRMDLALEQLERDACNSMVNTVRAEVRKACLASARSPSGVYSLTVPTGGGKTLAAMTFALHHAAHHNLDRVVVVVPFTSIIEQNASVYRGILGSDAVLEHHAALDPVEETPKNRIACENWDAPVVVTTTVQLFESLLANRPARCRKLHRLARSVIILDEAQALPGRLLPASLSVLDDLARNYSTTVVISTATQPALERSSVLDCGFARVEEICPSSMKLFERLKRVDISWPNSDQITTYEEIADEIARATSCLAIVHLRNDARELCAMVDKITGDSSTYHLSALMTPTHRSEVLTAIKTAQQRNEPVRVVSTQLVEAGVDLDFPIVFRALAGLDALAQAAGRCNREGRLATGELRVFNAPTQPPPGVLRTSRDIAAAMRRQNPILDIFDPDLMRDFFSQLYRRTDLAQGMELQDGRARLMFRTVGERFRMIEDDWSASLVVAHGAAVDAVADLRAWGPSRERLRALQRFTINVPKRALRGWIAEQTVTMVCDTVAVLEGAYLEAYDERFGLVPGRVGVADASAFCVG